MLIFEKQDRSIFAGNLNSDLIIAVHVPSSPDPTTKSEITNIEFSLISGSYSNRRKYRRKGNRKRVKGRKRQKYRQQEQPAYEDYSTGYGEEYESFDDDVS